MALAQRPLGRTDIALSPIGLGVWQLAEGKGFAGLFWRGLPGETADAIVLAALEGGVNWFDTAELYGRGSSETGLARALKAAGELGAGARVATKWWPLLRTAGSIPRTIGQRLAALEGLPIDLYQVHQPWSFSSAEAEMQAMAALLEAGQIRAVGVSNFSAQRMRRAQRALAQQGLPLASNQVKISLLDRRIERNGLLAAARELGVTLIAYSPLEQGLLTGLFHRDPSRLNSRPWVRRNILRWQLEKSRPLVAALTEIASDRGVTPAQVALNWLVTFYGETVVAIPGASRPRHAQESAGALAFQLAPEEMARLDQLSRPFR